MIDLYTLIIIILVSGAIIGLALDIRQMRKKD